MHKEKTSVSMGMPTPLVQDGSSSMPTPLVQDGSSSMPTLLAQHGSNNSGSTSNNPTLSTLCLCQQRERRERSAKQHGGLLCCTILIAS